MSNFNLNKYNDLKLKLHVSEVSFYDLISSSSVDRFDADFFDKDILSILDIYSRIHTVKFADLINILTDYTSNGSFASLAQNVNVVDQPSYAKWIRIMNLDRCDYSNEVRYIDKKGYDFLKKSSLKNGDLLISKTGEYLGKSYLFYDFSDEKCTLADNIFLLRLKNPSLEQYIYVYLRTKIGRKLLLRWSQGTGQPTIIKDSLRELLVPIFSNDFNNLIGILINRRFVLLQESKKIYEELTKNLLIELNFDPSISFSNINELTLSSSYGISGRLDSEYYLKKYVYLFDALKKFRCIKLGGVHGLCDIYKSFEPGSDCYEESGVPFIRVQDLSIYGVDEPKVYISESICSEIKKPKKDDILLSKDASIGIAYKLTEDANYVTSGAILTLSVKSDEILPEYLTLLLNSPIVKLQAERDSGGSIIKHWKPDQICEVQIPIIDIERQKFFAENFKISFEKLEESSYLLKLCQTSIEKAIFEGEEGAISFLRQKAQDYLD